MFAITCLNNIFGLKYSNDPKFVIIPVPWEGTVSYGKRTSLAPEAIRQASFQIDLHDYDFGSLEHLGINYLEQDTRIIELNSQAKDKKKLNELSQTLDDIVFQSCKKQKAFVILLGGEHSISLSGFKNTFLRHKEYSVLQLDAHMDLRKAYQGYTGSHASVMYNLMTSDFAPKSLVQVGIRDYSSCEFQFKNSNKTIHTFFDRDIKMNLHKNVSWVKICNQFIEKLTENVHITLDIDVLNPQYCTGTGTLVPGGLDFDQVVTLLKLVSEQRKIVGADLVEVSPLKGDNNLNANVGMRLLYKLIGFSKLFK